MENYCNNHPERKALSKCHICGEYYCSECLSEGMSYYYCKKEACHSEFEKEKPPDNESMKKLDAKLSSSSKLSYIIVSIVLLALAGTIGKKFAKEIFSTSESVSIEFSDWKIRNILNTGLSIETPFELNISSLELPTEYSSMIKEMSVYNYVSDPISINLTYAIYSDKIVPNLEGAANGAINSLRLAKGVEDFTSNISDIYFKEIKGRMILGKFKIQKQAAEYKGVIFMHESKTWQILCTYLANDENRVAVDRILNSVTIVL